MKPDLQSALAAADESLTKTGDVMEAISFVALAAKTGTPLPAHIGRWLAAALEEYRAGKHSSMDHALGLSQARRKLKSRGALQLALARMRVLRMFAQISTTPRC